MLEGVDPRELYGAQDVYLEQIKSLHPTLKIVARGQSLKVLGPEADTQRFAKRMEGLAAYYVKYGHVSAEVIEQCFAGGIAQDDAPVDKDVIVYGNNGTIVRARTVNQQRLFSSCDEGRGMRTISAKCFQTSAGFSATKLRPSRWPSAR